MSAVTIHRIHHAIVAHFLTTTSASPDDHNSPIPPVNIQFTQNININTFYKQDTFKNIVFPILQDKGGFIHFLHICARDKASHTKNKYSLVASSGLLVSLALFDQILISSNSNLWKHNKSSRYFPFSSPHKHNIALKRLIILGSEQFWI